MECWLYKNCKRVHCNDAQGCLIKYKLDHLYKEAGVNFDLRIDRTLRFDADGTDGRQFSGLKQVKEDILNFVESGSQLLIHSTIPGNGKTSWALKLMQAYFNKIWLKTDLRCRGLFIHVPTLLIALKDNISSKSEYVQHIKENIADCDLVIWDDIGAKMSTQFEADNLLSMIDTRISKNKCNIYTSNLTDSEMQQALGDRLASRICNLGYNVEFHGGDKRGLITEDSEV